jgi:hypothetical protein
MPKVVASGPCGAHFHIPKLDETGSKHNSGDRKVRNSTKTKTTQTKVTI